MRIEYHRTLIADRVRTAAFRAALASVIRRGETVVADIGAGTGLLGLMASRLGAREVVLYETAEVAGVAAAILKCNRVRECHLIPCHSTEMQDPPKADVVVSETLGNYALEEDIIETLNDARKRHLKPGGTIIPRSITQFVAPVVSPRIHAELSVWDDVGPDLDLSPAKILSFNNVYVRGLHLDEILDGVRSAHVWDSVQFSNANRTSRRGTASWTGTGPAVTVYGFAVWWQAELVPGISISTAPNAPATHWDQLYFPMMTPLEFGRGFTLQIALRSRSSRATGTHLAWTVTLEDQSGRQIARQAMNLDKGYLP